MSQGPCSDPFDVVWRVSLFEQENLLVRYDCKYIAAYKIKIYIYVILYHTQRTPSYHNCI